MEDISGFYLLGGGKLPPQKNVYQLPPKKSFTEKKFTAISNKDLFNDDFRESVKVTNVLNDFKESVKVTNFKILNTIFSNAP